MNLPAELLKLYDTPEYDGAGVTDLQRVDFEAAILRLVCEAYTPEDEPGH